MFDFEWANYCAAFITFFASHMILIRPPVKPVLVRFLGARMFVVAYSLLSTAILFWMIEAAQTAPYIEVWPWESWQNWVPIVVMIPVCLIISFAIGTPNPFSFGGWRNDQFKPSRPGIVRWMRHPILVALFLWSAAHTLPNGNLAHVVLFGMFAAFSLLGTRIIDRRQQRLMNEDWALLRKQTNEVSLFGAFQLRDLIIRLIVALLLYISLVHLHPLITGIYPFG